MPGPTQVRGVLRYRVGIHRALDDLKPVHETRDPRVLAPGHHALGQPVIEHEEAEVPEAGTCRGRRRELVEALVDLGRLDNGQAPYRVPVGSRVGIRHGAPDVVPDQADLVGLAKRQQQLVNVFRQAGFVVAGCGRVRPARAAQVGVITVYCSARVGITFRHMYQVCG